MLNAAYWPSLFRPLLIFFVLVWYLSSVSDWLRPGLICLVLVWFASSFFLFATSLSQFIRPSPSFSVPYILFSVLFPDSSSLPCSLSRSLSMSIPVPSVEYVHCTVNTGVARVHIFLRQPARLKMATYCPVILTRGRLFVTSEDIRPLLPSLLVHQ